jgi:hypothetical protein
VIRDGLAAGKARAAAALERTMARRIAIIGNANRPGVFGKIDPADWPRIARFVDGCDLVVRFNAARNQAMAWTGRRTDVLYLRGNGKPAYDYSQSPIRFEQVDPPRRAVLVVDRHHYPRPNIDRHFEVERCAEVVAANGFADWSVVAAVTLEAARARLGKDGSPLEPSLGFTAIVDLMRDACFADYEKYVAGFDFAGWKGHNWIIEKRIFQRWIADGVLRAIG